MSNIWPQRRAAQSFEECRRTRGMSADRRQRLGQGDTLVVGQRGDSKRADAIRRARALPPCMRIGQDRIEVRGTPLMRLAVPLDQLLTVRNLDGQRIILLRRVPDEFQPPADSSLFLRVPKGLAAPPAQ